MWVHLLIFLVPPFLLLTVKKGWDRGFWDREKRRRCFLLIFAGNILGCVLTFTANRELSLGPECALTKQEEEEYEELLEADTGKEIVKIPVRVPAGNPKEEESETPGAEPSPEELFAEAVQEEILRINEARRDEEKYYLPLKVKGTSLSWRRPYSSQGALLAALSLAAALGLAAALEREREAKLRKRQEQMELDYPALVMKLSLLLEAGLSVGRAFRKIAQDYQTGQRKEERRHAYEEVTLACQEMDSGVSEGEAYQRFGRRCGQIRYKTLAGLLVQNLKKGSRGLLDTLEQEADQAWEDRKRRARIQGEAAATKLLIPMVMMLGIVIAILIIPAFLSFYS